MRHAAALEIQRAKDIVASIGGCVLSCTGKVHNRTLNVHPLKHQGIPGRILPGINLKITPIRPFWDDVRFLARKRSDLHSYTWLMLFFRILFLVKFARDIYGVAQQCRKASGTGSRLLQPALADAHVVRTGMDTHFSHISALGHDTVQTGMDRHYDWHGRVWHGQAPQLRIGPSIVARFELEYSAKREPAPSPSIFGKSEPYRYQRVRVGSTVGRREAYGVAVRVLSVRFATTGPQPLRGSSRIVKTLCSSRAASHFHSFSGSS